MEFKLTLGVDISKEWFHYCLMNDCFEILTEGQVENTPDKIFLFMTQLAQFDRDSILQDILLCLEHTGIYINHLLNCWLSKGCKATVVHAPNVSDNLAGQIGWEEKTDQIDARRLAQYAFRFSDKLTLWKVKEQTLVKLQAFQRQRERLISAIHLLETPLNESKDFDNLETYQALASNQQESMNALKQDLVNLEKAILCLLKSDAYLAQLYKLITSVEGIGPVTAREIIIATTAFSDFLPDQAKSFARYVGVIPKKKESGKSVRKKQKISNRPHKKLKSLLTMGAQSLIRTNSELSIFYHRKIKEGKSHLSVINAMRNKMILRVFAVVRNQSIYQKNLNISLN